MRTWDWVTVLVRVQLRNDLPVTDTGRGPRGAGAMHVLKFSLVSAWEGTPLKEGYGTPGGCGRGTLWGR